MVGVQSKFRGWTRIEEVGEVWRSWEKFGGGGRSSKGVLGVRRRWEKFEGGWRSLEEVGGVWRRWEEFGGGGRSSEEVGGSKLD